MVIMALFLSRFPRLSFGIAGAIVSSGCFAFLYHWFTIFNEWLGMVVVYDTRPLWLVLLMSIATWFPWFLLVVILGLRFWRGSTYKPVAFSLGLAAPYAAVFSVLFLLPPLEDRWQQEAFDSQRWKAAQAANPLWPDRLRMVDDLIATVPLVGLPKGHVTELLGEGDKTSYWRDWDAVYWLGPERGLFGIDSEWLVLRFSSDGRVTEYRIVTD
ncbi:MAG: hypothetical protein L0H94_08755 [Nitrospira sp.]|nr:hypothetical protein [Nitrospira sp.]